LGTDRPSGLPAAAARELCSAQSASPLINGAYFPRKRAGPMVSSTRMGKARMVRILFGAIQATSIREDVLNQLAVLRQ
jgi:hypothetical protein